MLRTLRRRIRNINELKKLIRSLEEILENDCFLFLRSQGFETVGIITKIRHVHDGSWGVMRRQAVGMTFSGKKFEEFLDRKNKRTGSLEDIIQMQTDLLLVTARNTSNPDDSDSNFTYMIDQNTANRMKDKYDMIPEFQRVNAKLEKDLRFEKQRSKRMHNQLETAQSEANAYREKMFNFSEQVGKFKAQAEYYKTQLKREQQKLLEVEGFLNQKLRDASGIGELQAKDSSDIVRESAKKQYEAQRELDKLTNVDTATKSDVDNLGRKLLNHFVEKEPVKQKKENVKDEGSE